MQINQENGFARANALLRNRYPAVPDDPAPHFYEGNCSAFSIVKPLGIDTINYCCNSSFERGTVGWYPSYGTVVLTLYLFDLAYDGIRITSFDYGAISSVFLSLPAGHLSLFWTLVLASLLMSLTYSIIGVLFQADN